MKWSIYLFRVLGIRLELHITFLIFVILLLFFGLVDGGAMGLIESVIGLSVVFTTVVLHELGHCLTARYYHIHVPIITLTPIGGIAHFPRMPREPKQELLITLAGPAVNFTIVGLLFVCAGFSTKGLVNPADAYMPSTPIQFLFIGNLVMGVFNLLPIFPMDGGRIFRAAMASRLSYLLSTRIAFELAKVLALTGTVYFAVHGHFMGIALLGFVFLAGRLEYLQVRDAEVIGDKTVGDVMRSHFLAIPETARIHDAACFNPGFEPFDFIIMDFKGIPKGVVTLGQVKDAMQKDLGDEYLDTLVRGTVRSLQMHWPLSVYSSSFRKCQALHPVLYHDRVVGVVDTEQFWKILKGRNRNRTNNLWHGNGQ